MRAERQFAGSSQFRLIADDLTGALDAAAPLADRWGMFTAAWSLPVDAETAGIAFDTNSRDTDRVSAIQRTRLAAEHLWRGFPGLAFKKVDSVWRGHQAAEIVAALAAGGYERAIVAPAFPAQGRITRDGAQWVVSAEGARCVMPDLVADIQAAGLPASREDADAPRTPVCVCDASEDADLVRIVERHGRSGDSVLWCGTAGLARALAKGMPGARNDSKSAHPASDGAMGPVVVLVGSPNPVSQSQARMLAATPTVADRCIDLNADARNTAVQIPTTVKASVVLLRFAARPGTVRRDVDVAIRGALARAMPLIGRPRLAIVTGGATLRALNEVLGTSLLYVDGEHSPGVPRARWKDGAWAGVPLLSKSGGFGPPSFLIDLAASDVPSVPQT